MLHFSIFVQEVWDYYDPLSLPQREQEDFLGDRAGWVYRTLRREDVKVGTPFKPFIFT